MLFLGLRLVVSAGYRRVMVRFSVPATLPSMIVSLILMLPVSKEDFAFDGDFFGVFADLRMRLLNSMRW